MLLVGTVHSEAAKLVNSPAVNLSLGTASRDRLPGIVTELNILLVKEQDYLGFCLHL